MCRRPSPDASHVRELGATDRKSAAFRTTCTLTEALSPSGGEQRTRLATWWLGHFLVSWLAVVKASGVSGPSCGVAMEDALPAGRSDRVAEPEGGAAAVSGSARSDLNVSAPRRSGVECEKGRPLSSPELAVLLPVLS